MGAFLKFDASDYLDSEETIAEYLTAALEDENPMFSWLLWARSPKRAA
jgi:DNA-binding phage protein